VKLSADRDRSLAPVEKHEDLRERLRVPAVIITVHVFANGLLIALPEPHTHGIWQYIAVGLVWGIPSSSAALLAMWTLWWPQRATLKSLSLLGLLSLITVCFHLAKQYSIMLLLPAGHYLLALAAFWILRSAFSWQLWHVPSQSPRAASRSQFGIGTLMLWMTIVAVACALAQWFGINPTTIAVDEVYVYLLLAAVSVLLACVAVWAMFAARSVVASAMLAIPLVTLITWGEGYLISIIQWADLDLYFFLAAINATKLVVVGLSLLPLRRHGYRLARVGA
jgi:hypothetical protein